MFCNSARVCFLVCLTKCATSNFQCHINLVLFLESFNLQFLHSCGLLLKEFKHIPLSGEKCFGNCLLNF